jgi:hypothetical protein
MTRSQATSAKETDEEIMGIQSGDGVNCIEKMKLV